MVCFDYAWHSRLTKVFILSLSLQGCLSAVTSPSSTSCFSGFVTYRLQLLHCRHLFEPRFNRTDLGDRHGHSGIGPWAFQAASQLSYSDQCPASPKFPAPLDLNSTIARLCSLAKAFGPQAAQSWSGSASDSKPAGRMLVCDSFPSTLSSALLAGAAGPR